MIPTLYPIFRSWSERGSVYLISDTHFEDNDCKLMDPDWITPEEHLEKILKKVHRNDTLIHLGDVGNPEWMKHVKAHKVLLLGNHDGTATRFEPYFDEVYTGPLMIAEKIILSHEPIPDIDWAFNIHGHDHSRWTPDDDFHFNVAANVVCFEVINLADIIKSGVLRNVSSLHRQIIDRAGEKRAEKEAGKNAGKEVPERS